MKRLLLPVDALAAWAKLNDVTLNGTEVRRLQAGDGVDKGSTLVATRERSAERPGPGESIEPEILVQVPVDLILSQSLVEIHAKADRHLKAVLDAVGEFGKTARGAILIYLLLLLTHSSGNPSSNHVGLSNPWTSYIQFLPESYPLPTFYSDAELEILIGTSLKPALDAKMDALQREYENLRAATINIPWCRDNWWDGLRGKLTFNDWKIVDAMYRSRALEIPGIGHAMAPCVDMANHASGDETTAVYEIDQHNNVVLQLRPGRSLREGDEVTITYGDDKGAAEMIFSYGFLESTLENAQQLFLELSIPEDDPLKPAKMIVCGNAPGVRIFMVRDPEGGVSVDWESPFVWWACINEEDGLKFEILQSNDGAEEMKAAWKGKEIENSQQLCDLLQREPLWDVFRLRATVLVQERIEAQLELLRASLDYVLEWRDQADGTTVRAPVWDAVMKLRELEENFLDIAFTSLEAKKIELANTAVVCEYLKQYSPGADISEDFS